MKPSTFDVINQVAYAIATQLSSERTDHNELAKASTYLSQTQNSDDFFEWLEWMATDRVSKALARSNRTPVYYQQIRNACRQLKAIPYPEGTQKAEQTAIMAQTLAWAVRLMRYMPVAKPLDGEASLQFNGGATHGATGTIPERKAATTAPRPRSLRDLQPGMQLTGTVKRTAPFGAFVDVGVGRDGLVHVSKLRREFVSDVESVVTQGATVTVWVEEVDVKQGRIVLTMIAPAAATAKSPTTKQTSMWAEAPSPAAVTTAQTTAHSAATEAVTPKERPTQSAAKAAPEPKSTPAKAVAVTLTAPEQAVAGLLVKGRVQRVEVGRLVVDIGLAEPASLTFERLPTEHTDPDDVAELWPAGSELEVVIVHKNKRGRIQLALAEG